MAKTLLLTFDVELFFGRSGSLVKCILEPVERLRRMFAERGGIKGTFFVDVLHYLRLAEVSRFADEAARMRGMMAGLAAEGHRIELHLHPHWLDAVREGSEWVFPSYRRYRLQALSRTEITDLFVSGSQALNEASGPGYRVSSFRAGGYCITPFSDLAEGFRKAGIRTDSSVAKGFAYKSGSHDFDFTSAPDSECYRFGYDPLVEDPAGEFLEVPIGTFRKGLLDKALVKAEKTADPERFRAIGDGKGMVLENVQVSNRALRKLAPAWEMYSLDNGSRRLFLSKARSDRRQAITVVSHPKMLTPESFRTVAALAEAGFGFETIHQYTNRSLAP